jgi:hypothetical protein
MSHIWADTGDIAALCLGFRSAEFVFFLSCAFAIISVLLVYLNVIPESSSK